MALDVDAPSFGELLQLRRSHREFTSGTVPAEHVDHVLACAGRFAERCGFTAPRILAATELGYGTCWMSGIDHERVEQVHPLPDGARLIAISPLGQAPGRSGWRDGLRHLLLKDRTPLSEVTMQEVWR